MSEESEFEKWKINKAWENFKREDKKFEQPKIMAEPKIPEMCSRCMKGDPMCHTCNSEHPTINRKKDLKQKQGV